jgi:hypothetical protein
MSEICRAGVIDPVALDASENATTRVRSPTSLASASRSSVASSVLIGAVLTISPWSLATASQGATFASWSSAVTTISSPGSNSRATACASRKFSVVMFAPNAISVAALPVSRPAAARAVASSSTVSRDVANTPPSFAVPRRR